MRSATPLAMPDSGAAQATNGLASGAQPADLRLSPRIGAPESGIPEPEIGRTETAGETHVPVLRHLPQDVAGCRVPVSGATSAQFRGVPESGIPLDAIYEPSRGRSNRIRRATRVQDGHSLGEQALYDALWQAARPYSPDGRAITIGYRGMSGLSRLTVNNCKANIRALIQKLAVSELSPFSHARGTTYLVYNFTAILQRRKAVGFTHCIRSRGVVFVDPDIGAPLTTSTHSKSGTPDSGTPKTSAVPESDKTGAPGPDRSGIPHADAPKHRNRPSHLTQQGTTTSFPAVPTQLTKGLQALIPVIDEEALITLWTECRARVADCTAEEVLHFAETKACMFATGKIQNPVGFLLTVVPKCFEGEAFVNFREEARRREENRQKAERERDQTRRAEEELARREAEAYERAEEKLRALPKDAYETLYQRTKDLIDRSSAARLWSPQVLEDTIRARMLRELQRQE